MIIQEAVITNRHEVQLQERELDGSKLGQHQLLIKTTSTFISAGTELANYTGLDPDVDVPGSWCCYPWTAGYANVGVIQECGTEVRRLKPGQRVFTFGPHASAHIWDLQNANMSRRLAVEVPAQVDDDVGAAARMAHVAMTALDVASAPAGQFVTVSGLGMVGNLAAQMFQASGATVIGIDPSERRQELARQCGIAHAIGGDTAAVLQQVESLTNDKKAAICIDAVGDSSVAINCMKLAAINGEVILLGTPRASRQGDVNEVFSLSHRRWITVKSALEWRVPPYHDLAHQHSQQKKHEIIMMWLMEGRLQLKPLITHHLPAAAVGEAYEGLLHKKDEYMGVVLDWG